MPAPVDPAHIPEQWNVDRKMSPLEWARDWLPAWFRSLKVLDEELARSNPRLATTLEQGVSHVRYNAFRTYRMPWEPFIGGPSRRPHVAFFREEGAEPAQSLQETGPFKDRGASKVVLQYFAEGDLPSAAAALTVLKLWPAVVVSHQQRERLRERSEPPQLARPLAFFHDVPIVRFDGERLDPLTYSRDDLLRDLTAVPGMEGILRSPLVQPPLDFEARLAAAIAPREPRPPRRAA